MGDQDTGEFFTDAPITEASADRFGRGPWARRIAAAVAAQRDPASVVIGIYAPWGDGKTSALNLLETALRADERVIPVRFNPWRLGDEAEMFHGFFATLADAVDTQLVTTGERIGSVLRTYGGLLVPLPGLGSAAKSAADVLGGALSEATLTERRSRIEKALADTGTRVVILIDDLDRLDRGEIQAMFRLVKTAADFSHTAYILAFDGDVVADALAERYAGGTAHGSSFMDKIVQLPLHLPPASPGDLRKLALDAVGEALDQAKLNLNEKEAGEYVSVFDRAIGPRLTTPRATKRYVNALLFALPMQDELYVPDVLMVEALRVCYPTVYTWVRRNETLVLNAARDEEAKEQVRAGITEAVQTLRSDDVPQVHVLLLAMFPRLQATFGNVAWGSDWEATWTEQRRIASRLYFRRYFTYSIPPGEVSDADISALLETMADPGAETDVILERSERVFATKDAGALLQKLAARLPALDQVAAARLAACVSLHAHRFSTRSGFLGLSELERAAILVRDLIRQTPEDERRGFVRELMAAAPRLPFAIDLIRWLRPQERDPERAVVDQDTCDEAGAVLAARVLEAWGQPDVLDRLEGAVAASMRVAAAYGDREALRRVLAERAGDATSAVELMRAFLGRSWDATTGVPTVSEFRREGYNALAEYVDAEALFAMARDRYGEDVGSGDKYAFHDLPGDERLIKEFANVHRTVLAEQRSESAGDGADDGATPDAGRADEGIGTD
ncbi:KAP family P-loop NTPase fold protein [Cellulomonas uda]|uniref:KAP NTPase domain-containing protein n=1 Tax=Cellulomonas uda TaxID=1714 RepID=A0A4Y3KH20_CELUD|nr:P-loop NTPase fold protein [Cellulomonas uda]NII66882.1 hypothetical protein [Cellulomonas uda]GEA82240.1 hypothetical protein CUD01_26840 [Cellulomonas uda]